MVAVTYEEFFATIGPLNVAPCTYDPNVTIWEVVTTRKVVGRSYPGWRIQGPPQPSRYELRKDLVKRGLQQNGGADHD